MKYLCKKIIVKFCIRRVYTFFLSGVRGNSASNSKCMQIVYIFSLILICGLVIAAGHMLFNICRQAYRTLAYKALISSLAAQFPRVTEVDCRVFMGDAAAWNDSVQSLSKLDNLREEIFDYTDCGKLRARGFDIPTTEAEMRFPVAFSIIVYTDMQRFTRLFRAVYRSSNVYCIHVDRKSSHEFKVRIG